MAGIPLRLAHCRENPYLLLTDWLAETEPAQQLRHEVERQLDLVAGFAPRPPDLRLSFRVSDADRAALTTRLRTAGVDPQAPRIVVHPGASAPSRRWPAAHFAQTVRELAQCQQREIVLTGGAGETTLASAITAQAGNPACVHDLSGRLSLGELGALLEDADLLIANTPVRCTSPPRSARRWSTCTR